MREPLVLIHGFTGTAAMWEPVRERLAEDHDVHALTIAGHSGGVPLADGVECSISALADAIEADMDAAGLETAHICGNSLGGWLALELATRGRARSVVAISPAGGWIQGSREERRLARYFRRLRRMTRFAVPRAERIMRSPRLRRMALRDVCPHGERVSPEHAVGLVRGASECTLWEDLVAAIERDGPATGFEGIDCPALIAWGTRDRVLPYRRHVPRLRELVPDAEYLELTGSGHCPMLDEPERTADVILGVTAAQAAPAVS
jgi:pimeloyl-ACP methyl ester carboxylesterase